MVLDIPAGAQYHSGMANLLRDFREAKGLTQAGLAELAGTSQPQINRLENSKRKLSKEWAEKLAGPLGITATRLMFGPSPDGHEGLTRVPAGHEFPPDPDPDEPATMGSETGLRGVPDGGSAQIDVTAGLGAGGLTIVSDGIPGKQGMTFAAEHVRDYWRLPHDVLRGMGLRATDVVMVPVQGDSMTPTLIETDFVALDTRHRLPSPDGLYGLVDEFGGIVIKRLELAEPVDGETMVRVISDNPKHKAKEWRLSDMRIIGRVLRKFGVVG